MRFLLLVLILLVAFTPVQAQESPVKRLCADNPYGRMWNSAIIQAVAEFNRITPSVLTSGDCDIWIVVTDSLPCGTGYTGCTYPGDPVRVYMAAGYAQRVSNLLHELAHAYGMWEHVEGVLSVTNQGLYSYARLTAYDVRTLRGMYP